MSTFPHYNMERKQFLKEAYITKSVSVLQYQCWLKEVNKVFYAFYQEGNCNKEIIFTDT